MNKHDKEGKEGSDFNIELMTAKEVAEALKISIVSVRRLQQGRHIPFIKVGGSIRFAKGDIAAYLKRRTVASMHYV